MRLCRFSSSKLTNIDYIKNIRSNFSTSETVVGFCNGTFQLIHSGHLDFLNTCKRNCDILIVGINSDKSLGLNNKRKSYLTELERAYLICAFSIVDYVVLFDEKTPENIIDKIKPDIYFVVDEYEGKISVNMPTVYVNKTNRSTTKLIEYLKGKDEG